MSLAGYWTSNMLFDILIAYIPIGLIILLMYVFGKFYDGIWVMFLLYPPAVVPYTYVKSFLFSDDVSAQIVTLFNHFVFGAIGTALVFSCQQIPEMMYAADILRWVFTICPSFCVTHSILWSASGALVVSSRGESDTGGKDPYPIPRTIPKELWAWYNLKGDAVILCGHFIFWTFVLFLIEMEIDLLFVWCPGLSCRKSSKKQR